MLAHTSPLKESMYESDIKRTHERGHAVAREPRRRRAPPEISRIDAHFCKGVSPKLSTLLDHPHFFPQGAIVTEYYTDLCIKSSNRRLYGLKH